MIEEVSKASGNNSSSSNSSSNSSGSGRGSGQVLLGEDMRQDINETGLSLAYLGFTWFFTLKPVLLRQCSK